MLMRVGSPPCKEAANVVEQRTEVEADTKVVDVGYDVFHEFISIGLHILP